MNEDYLNKLKKRNENNTKSNSYNCGGYALRTYSWYLPYEDEDELNWEVSCYDFEDEEDLLTVLTERCVEKIAEDFRGSIRCFVAYPEISYDPAQYELIAFRVSADLNDFYECEDWDFHFKVLRDGRWMEKNGSESIHECDEDDWDGPGYFYNGDTVYFLHKIAQV